MTRHYPNYEIEFRHPSKPPDPKFAIGQLVYRLGCWNQQGVVVSREYVISHGHTWGESGSCCYSDGCECLFSGDWFYTLTSWGEIQLEEDKIGTLQQAVELAWIYSRDPNNYHADRCVEEILAKEQVPSEMLLLVRQEYESLHVCDARSRRDTYMSHYQKKYPEEIT